MPPPASSTTGEHNIARATCDRVNGVQLFAGLWMSSQNSAITARTWPRLSGRMPSRRDGPTMRDASNRSGPRIRAGTRLERIRFRGAICATAGASDSSIVLMLGAPRPQREGPARRLSPTRERSVSQSRRHRMRADCSSALRYTQIQFAYVRHHFLLLVRGDAGPQDSRVLDCRRASRTR
jgi:hypothetical protein